MIDIGKALPGHRLGTVLNLYDPTGKVLASIELTEESPGCYSLGTIGGYHIEIAVASIPDASPKPSGPR